MSAEVDERLSQHLKSDEEKNRNENSRGDEHVTKKTDLFQFVRFGIGEARGHQSDDDVRRVADQRATAHQHRAGGQSSNDVRRVDRMFGEENVEKTDGRTVFVGRRSVDGDVVTSSGVARETDVNGSVVEKRPEQTRDEEERLKRRNGSGHVAALRQPTFAPKSI